MTEHQPSVVSFSTRSRPLGWIAIACAAVSLALTAAARISGGAVRWTAWALPLLVAANASVFSLGALQRRPRLARPFFILSFATALGVVVSEAFVLWHR